MVRVYGEEGGYQLVVERREDGAATFRILSVGSDVLRVKVTVAPYRLPRILDELTEKADG